MKKKQNDTTYFRQYRTFDGKLEPVGIVLRNKEVVPQFSPTVTDPPVADRTELKRLLREVMYGLNGTERRTWLLLLLGYSVASLAQKEKVSRAAIYARIHGTSRKP